MTICFKFVFVKVICTQDKMRSTYIMPRLKVFLEKIIKGRGRRGTETTLYYQYKI